MIGSSQGRRNRDEPAADDERREGNPLQKTLNAVDDAQARIPLLAFPVAVVKKFGDDQAGNLAALIAYYGFFSIFPLLLALTTILGFVFQNNPDVRTTIRDSALQQFPVIGTQLANRSLSGNWLALAVGLVGAIWAGLGVLGATQNALDAVWDVPRVDRPNLVGRTLKGLLMLGVAGAFLSVSGYLSGIGQGHPGLSIVQILSVCGSVLLNAVLFATAFRILTTADVSWREVAPGAALAAIAWTILLIVGQWFVTSRIRGARDVYGTFAVVLGLLSWLYLASQITLFSAEVNVVLKKRLWPRSMTTPPVRDADERSYDRQVFEQERIRPQDIRVDYTDAEAERSGGGTRGAR